MNYLFIGGQIANSFLQAMGFNIGRSIVRSELLDESKEIMHLARQNFCQIMLPVDVMTSSELTNDATVNVKPINYIDSQDIIGDIGPQTIANLDMLLSKCQFCLWYGSVGAYSFDPFKNGTNTICQIIAHHTQKHELVSMAGAEEVVKAINNTGFNKEFSYITIKDDKLLEYLAHNLLSDPNTFLIH